MSKKHNSSVGIRAKASSYITKQKDGLLERRWREAGKQCWATGDEWKGLLSYAFYFIFTECAISNIWN